MIDREDLGGWIHGAPTTQDHVPGSTWGLPASGPGSVAPIGRRFFSYLVDWGISLGLSVLVSGGAAWVWVIFTAMCVLLLTLVGATGGQFLLGLRVRPVTGRLPMVLRALIRTVLLDLLIPTLVWNRERQPLQDVLAGTAVVRA